MSTTFQLVNTAGEVLYTQSFDFTGIIGYYKMGFWASVAMLAIFFTGHLLYRAGKLFHEYINGKEIDKNEFFNFCNYYCTKEKSESLFNKINQRSRSINFLEFEEFLEIIDFKDYNQIMNSLEKSKNLKNIDELSNINELNIFN